MVDVGTHDPTAEDVEGISDVTYGITFEGL